MVSDCISLRERERELDYCHPFFFVFCKDCQNNRVVSLTVVMHRYWLLHLEFL